MTFPKSTITEDVSSQVDGVSTTFTIVGGPYIAGTLVVELNGLRQAKGVGCDFVENATFDGFTMLDSPRVGDTLQVQFEIEDAGTGFVVVVASGIDPTC